MVKVLLIVKFPPDLLPVDQTKRVQQFHTCTRPDSACQFVAQTHPKTGFGQTQDRKNTKFMQGSQQRPLRIREELL